MRKQLLYLASILLSSIVFISATEGILSSGAPPSKTGAPGELTCATAGCHDDFGINSGTAKIELFANDQLFETYTPGTKYQLKVKVSDEAVVRFGYQLVALDEASNNSGTLQISDVVRTQLVKNTYELFDRVYATYTYEGTAATNAGSNAWEVDWIAPASNVGDITFYLSGVSANDDGEDSYDQVVTSSVKISSNTSVAELTEENIFVSTLNYHNIIVNSGLSFLGGELLLVSQDGKLIFQSEIVNEKTCIDINSYSTGVYFLSLKNGMQSFNQKVLVLK